MDNKEILILDTEGVQFAELFSQLLPDTAFNMAVDLEQAAPYLDTAQIVMGRPDLVAGAVPRMPRLEWVQSTWAGITPLLAPRLRRDYLLTGLKGVFGPQMSEYIFGYLAAHVRRFTVRQKDQANQHWLPGELASLQHKTLGIMGVGSIGRHVARTAKLWEMRVHGYTRASRDCSDVDEFYHRDRLYEFAASVDCLAIILPDTPQNDAVINAEFLKQMRSHAVIVNVGRGNSIDEPALAQALRDQTIAAAVLDVFRQEPLPKDHYFWDTPNLTITPHVAASSFARDIVPVFVENLVRRQEGRPLKYVVDFENGY